MGKLPGKYIRGGPPRVLRSPMTEAWYVVTSYHDLGEGKFLASAKREVHPDDAKGLEAAYQAHKDWESGKLVASATPDTAALDRLTEQLLEDLAYSAPEIRQVHIRRRLAEAAELAFE